MNGTSEIKEVLDKAITAMPEDLRLIFTFRNKMKLETKEISFLLQITESEIEEKEQQIKELILNQINQNYEPDKLFEFNLIYCDSIVNRVMDEINKLENK